MLSVHFVQRGFWPVTRHVFEDHHLAPADALCSGASSQPGCASPTEDRIKQQGHLSLIRSPESELDSEDESNEIDSDQDKDYVPSSKILSHFQDTLLHISSLPKAVGQPGPTGSRRRQRRAQKAFVITRSPYKLDLQLSAAKGNQTIELN